MSKSIKNANFTCLLVLLSSLSISSEPTYAYNSDEHKILGDLGAEKVSIPTSAKLPKSLTFQSVTPADYQKTFKLAKSLASGIQNRPESKAQDKYYSRGFKQSELNKMIWIPPETKSPSKILSIPCSVSYASSNLSFGDLVALYGDYKRTVTTNDSNQCYLTKGNVSKIRFDKGTASKKRFKPDPVNADVYLKTIASGLCPPFGSLGNKISNTAGPTEYDEAGWWGDEMMRLAVVNDWHFSSGAAAWYVGMHRLALYYAEKAIKDPNYWVPALHCEASALHSLTDLFAFGHVIVNRGETSRQIVLASNVQNTPTCKWMENILRLGGATRSKSGRIFLSSDLPKVTIFPADRKGVVEQKGGNLRSYHERNFHDGFNQGGALVRNLRGDVFRVYGDSKLRTLSDKDFEINKDAVTTSLQSLFNAFGLMKAGKRTLESICKPGSKYYQALKFIPVYIEEDQNSYFSGMWTNYAKYADDLTGSAVVPTNWKNCLIPFVDGSTNELKKQSEKCSAFPRKEPRKTAKLNDLIGVWSGTLNEKISEHGKVIHSTSGLAEFEITQEDGKYCLNPISNFMSKITEAQKVYFSEAPGSVPGKYKLTGRSPKQETTIGLSLNHPDILLYYETKKLGHLQSLRRDANLKKKGTPSSQSLVGFWNSNYGRVYFRKNGSVYSGYFQSEKGRGVIKNGSFNNKSKTLTFEYYQPWNKANGSAELKLVSASKLVGTWHQVTGSGKKQSGPWDMSR